MFRKPIGRHQVLPEEQKPGRCTVSVTSVMLYLAKSAVMIFALWCTVLSCIWLGQYMDPFTGTTADVTISLWFVLWRLENIAAYVTYAAVCAVFLTALGIKLFRDN
jgi:hypothetical protein